MAVKIGFSLFARDGQFFNSPDRLRLEKLADARSPRLAGLTPSGSDRFTPREPTTCARLPALRSAV